MDVSLRIRMGFWECVSWVPGLQGPLLPPHGGSIEVIEDKDGLL